MGGMVRCVCKNENLYLVSGPPNLGPLPKDKMSVNCGSCLLVPRPARRRCAAGTRTPSRARAATTAPRGCGSAGPVASSTTSWRRTSEGVREPGSAR
eukprot:9498808-Pyramimonas_sp.AAC.1